MSISRFDEKMFEFARQAAKQSDFRNFKLGCAIVYKKHVIATGCNTNKTHPAQKEYNKKYRHFIKSDKPIMDSLHAEIAALSSIPYTVEQDIDWKQVKVYVYRICRGKIGGYGLSKPCAACMAALRDKGVRHLYYTGEGSLVYERLDY